MKRREFLEQMTLGGVLVYFAGCEQGSGTVKYDYGVPDAGTGDGSPIDGGPIDWGDGMPVRQLLGSDWRFVRDETRDCFASDLDDSAWERAVLPHTARVEALVTGAPASPTYQWQGICWYRRKLLLGPEAEGRRVMLLFEGAMNVAEVWLDGEPLGQHLGGYLPFGFDISARVTPGKEHILAVRLDNKNNSTTGPKPLGQLDFNWYGGLYRSVSLVVKARLHITDPLFADKPASGGVFVRYPRVSSDEAEVSVQVHVRNDDVAPRTCKVRAVLVDATRTVAEGTSEVVTLAPGSDAEIVQSLIVSNPALWSPRHPNLYTLRTELVDQNTVVDQETTRIGIRRIEISTAGFRINGEPMFLRGTNRHQEYPYIGYALSDAAQYRDAKKIKDAGFDFVRLSHYPHHSAFMDACDELGLVVMNAIPGWQYFSSAQAFVDVQYDNCRRMLRRDRNHPCVILWEVSLNESEMSAAFIARAHAIAHEEYPGDQCFTCGWKRGYDVFIQARQHGGCRNVTDVPCEVSEYGDWEYYAANAGLNQEGWSDLAPEDANSRQLRSDGERALLQQATNFQEAHNDNLATLALGDGLWVMYDYNRGYATDLEASGCMDVFRLPKFSYYFFQSQRDATERYTDSESGPTVFIASWWTPESSTSVRVFSNCDEVELTLDGILIERRRPDQDRISSNLRHAPFTFALAEYRPGTLEARAYLAGVEAARHTVRTPGPVRRLELRIDQGGRPFAATGKDAVFVHAELKDSEGTLTAAAWENVAFGVTGSASLVGANPFSSVAGIASILLQAETSNPDAAVYGLAVVRDEEVWHVLSGAVEAGGAAQHYDVRVTTDGSAPGVHSPLYTDPLQADRVRAALFVGGEPVTEADSAQERFSVPG